jgi:hypothetical protein
MSEAKETNSGDKQPQVIQSQQPLPEGTVMTKDVAASWQKKSRAGRTLRWARNVLLFAAGTLALILLDNNFSLSPTSRQAFTLQLERSIHLSTDWLAASPQEDNPALVYMIADMAEMSGEIRLRRIVDGYLKMPIESSSVWRHQVDGTTQVRPVSRKELESYGEYQRWIAYGVAPHQVPLTNSERSNMFSANKYYWGRRTHQLFALLMYRKHGEVSEAIDQLINHLCERIAFEADLDFRVTDLYLQRIAFLLAAGRPDLVKRRWVERIVAKQEQNGGWIVSWHGWGPGLFEINFGEQKPNSHATVQGTWILYMLKYRYPGWIEQNYK